jgi:hypothetical protein
MIALFAVLITTLIIAIILSLLFKSSEDELEDKKNQREKKEGDFKGADPKKVYGSNWDKNLPRPRICPACGTALKKSEFLYAAIDDNVPPGTKKPVHIYGCRYCYLGLTRETEISETLDI